MADEEDVSEIRQRLAENSAYFDSLVKLIPAKYYFPDNEEEKQMKFYKNRGQKAPKQALKENSKKAKRARLDPSQQKSVLDLQQESETTKKGDSEILAKKEFERPFSVENVKSADLGDLRSRLHQKIELLRGKRKANHYPSNDKNIERPKKKSKSEVKSHKKNKAISGINSDKPKNLAQSKKQVLNENGEVVFSKFDFTRDVEGTITFEGKAKNYKKLLASAEARKKKVDGLKAVDANKAKEVQQEINWQNAIEKAEGIKQKNDPSLLKKTIKRKEKLKQKHRKEWKERTEMQKKQIEERQKMRKKHIRERIDAKKNKNMNKGKKKSFNKKGHKPGF